ncbi:MULTISPECIES: o-succinylbenzoate synthase [Providencia]|uniref:o-succinylbenzoate synthase n=1 Tax=Providencia huaxiensis TaxID=2027290 RepID=A0A345LSE2_9GAMM|nr:MULTISPECIES: o-succinylbenzoate synthase [Providencia]MBZ3680287.1 o-succinylbenzoate synthase [Providencia rettgeri]AXH61032.1 o-succinylbenzoate synthase [Providencia huaxiensis]MBQ0267030.1 o-succinylbenzoate synthase [Providencia huaxiensis]MCG9533624.1 o-succinylbenzoate synthase [Providencia huaxiensis]MDT0133347.1 o-succinylbenzoate synthase [Providencia huaxiensis]
MRKAKIYSFSLPMEAGVILRYQRLKTRDGLLVCLQDGDNEGWGEISPLPEFSRETLEEATAETIVRLNEWVKEGKISNSLLPSVAFGCSCAIAELTGELPEQADYRKAPLCSGDPDDLILSLDAMEGEKVAKVKVGLYEAVRDGMVVNLLLEAVPELKLRLDANRSWTRAKADGFAKYVNPDYRDRIAFLEEPCKTREESLQFAAETGISIAWDESVREEGFMVEAQEGVSAIVIKPTLTGSLSYCRYLAEEAHRLGLQAVISSSIESSFGLTQLARIAHWLTPNTIPGLDTVSLIQSQLVRPWPQCDIPLQQLDDLTLVWQN